jgi:hypothetical protein
MKNDKQLDDFIDLCKRMYERMEREGSWPWADSPNSEDLVESEDNPENI